MAPNPYWLEELSNMLLAEPGSRVEGNTQDVLTVVYGELLLLLVEAGMVEERADALAQRHITRLHAAWANNGMVVRDYAGE